MKRSVNVGLATRRELLRRAGNLAGAISLASTFSHEKVAAAEAVPKYLSAESTVPPYDLPELLRSNDGRRVSSPSQWSARRAEILELFRAHVYGRAPGRPEKLEFTVAHRDSKALEGTATLKQVTIRCGHEGRQHEFGLILFLPNQRRPAPVFLLLNNRGPENTDPTREKKSGFWPVEEVVGRGYGIAAIQVNEVARDKKDEFRTGVIRLMEGDVAQRPNDAWKTISAWAWGASRALDYLLTDGDMDPARVAVVGHSRGGKTSLWAAAQDDRFAMAVSNDSGCTGAALSRRRVGETVARINTAFPHWFCDRYREYNDREAALPVDQHMLIGAIAPRPVYVASAEEDLWADPKGEFLSLAHASPAFRLHGEPGISPTSMPELEKPLSSGRQAYHIRRGGHNLTPYDWQRYLDFADQLWQTPGR